MNAKTINGVPADRWGTWCPHEIRIVEPDPADSGCDYPRSRIVDPWPCDKGCTREAFERHMDEAEAEFEADRWDAYWDMVRGGLR